MRQMPFCRGNSSNASDGVAPILLFIPKPMDDSSDRLDAEGKDNPFSVVFDCVGKLKNSIYLGKRSKYQYYGTLYNRFNVINRHGVCNDSTRRNYSFGRCATTGVGRQPRAYLTISFSLLLLFHN